MKSCGNGGGRNALLAAIQAGKTLKKTKKVEKKKETRFSDDIFIHVCFHVRAMSPSSLSYDFHFQFTRQNSQSFYKIF